MAEQDKQNGAKRLSFDLENSTQLHIDFVGNSLASMFTDVDLDLTVGKVAQEQNNSLAETDGSGTTEPSVFQANYDHSTGLATTTDTVDFEVATIQVLDWLFTLPTEENDLDTFKSANEAIYYAITGAAYTDTAFSSDDLTRLFIAESEILCGLVQCKRAIEDCGVTSITNEALKSRLVFAMGFDSGLITGNYPVVVNKFNEVAREFNKLTLPQGIAGVDKHIKMCSTLFADDLHAKTQIVLFRHHVLYDTMAAIGDNGELGVLAPTNYFDTLNGPSMDIIQYLDMLKNAIIRLYDSSSYQSSFNPKLAKAYRLSKELGGMELGPYYQVEELDYVKPPKELFLEFDHSMFVTLRAIKILPVYLLNSGTNATRKITNDTTGSEEYYNLNIWTRSYLGKTHLVQGCKLVNSSLLTPGLVLCNKSNGTNMLLDIQGQNAFPISMVGQYQSKILDFGHYPYDNLTAATMLLEQHRYRVEIMWFKYSGTTTQERTAFLADASNEVFYRYTVYMIKTVDGVQTSYTFQSINSIMTSTVAHNCINGMAFHPNIMSIVNGARLNTSTDVDNPLRVPFDAIADARKGMWKYIFNYSIISKVGEQSSQPATRQQGDGGYRKGKGKKKGKGKPPFKSDRQSKEGKSADKDKGKNKPE